MNLKIGVISARQDAEEAFGHFASESGCTLIFRTGILYEALDLALELQAREHVDAIITIATPMEVFDDSVTTPIYPVYATDYDILSSLYEARNIGVKLAFAEMPLQSVLYDYDRIVAILGFDVTHYKFTDRKSLEAVVHQVIADGRDVLVTMGGYTHAYAKSLKFPSVLIMPGAHSFHTTLENVRISFAERQAEAEKIRWLSAAFDHFQEGIILLDHEKKVVVINTPAQKFMHLRQQDTIGKHIGDVHSPNPTFRKFVDIKGNFDVVKSKNNEYVVRKEVLYADKTPLGIMLSASPVTNLQKMELAARIKINESGFVAANTFPDIRGSCKMFEAVKKKAMNYAQSKSNIVLYGESGCGKEIFAQSIHNASPCAHGPFVAINCTVLTETLLESELFGYEDGAFTGAKKGGQAGLFELAHKGTLFLDEIGDMPLSIQVKFLRVLQERIVRRIGGNKNIPIDVRFIFATNRNLKQDIAAGRFRSDLYYRINVLPLKIPPLREHREDIREIAQEILRKLFSQTNKQLVLSDEIIRLMQMYDWPGNIRELSNFLERAMFLDTPDPPAVEKLLGELFGESQLPSATHDSVAANIGENGVIHIKLDAMRNMERAIIIMLYHQYDGNIRKIREVLHISSSSMYRKIKEMNLNDLSHIN